MKHYFTKFLIVLTLLFCAFTLQGQTPASPTYIPCDDTPFVILTDSVYEVEAGEHHLLIDFYCTEDEAADMLVHAPMPDFENPLDFGFYYVKDVNTPYEGKCFTLTLFYHTFQDTGLVKFSTNKVFAVCEQLDPLSIPDEFLAPKKNTPPYTLQGSSVTFNTPHEVKVYNILGALENYYEQTTYFELQKGIHILHINNQAYKVLVQE